MHILCSIWFDSRNSPSFWGLLGSLGPCLSLSPPAYAMHAPTCFAFEAFPGRTLRVALFTGVANGGCASTRLPSTHASRPEAAHACSALVKLLVAGTLSPEAAFVNATMARSHHFCAALRRALTPSRALRASACVADCGPFPAAPGCAQGAGSAGGWATHHAHAAQRAGF